jgi:nicotinate-nucleotide adenylyltransferase
MQSKESVNTTLLRIGILGGSFDPPHYGHLEMAKAALTHLNLDEVVMLPANRNPLKTRRMAPPDQRLEMLKLLVRNEPKTAVSDIELTRGGMSYAVDTVAELQMVQPAEYWFILGSDSLKAIGDWKAPHRLFKMCRFAVVNRDLRKDFHFPPSFPEEFRQFVDVVPMPPHPASSTEVRERVVRKRDLSTLLPPSILSYIRDKHLYEH